MTTYHLPEKQYILVDPDVSVRHGGSAALVLGIIETQAAYDPQGRAPVNKRDLARQLGCNPDTIVRALTTLERGGLIELIDYHASRKTHYARPKRLTQQ